MELSIIGMIEFNMFGIPMVGADICGFSGATSEELCARWMELGSFYPYSRNHNDDGSPDQDPAVWPAVAEISRNVLSLRYKYLPYLYSLLHRSNSDGHSVVRPLFNVFPSDPASRGIDDQFFWGDGIMVAPVMVPSAVTRAVYFPKADWYELDSGKYAATGPKMETVDAPLEKIPVYVRGGIILPFQYPSTTTTQSRKNGFGFTVALDKTKIANGEVFWDDGVTDQPSSEAFLALISFDSVQLKTSIVRNPEAAVGLNIETIDFFGFPSNPSAVTVNGVPAAADSWTYDSILGKLTYTDSIPLNEPLTMVITY